MSRTYNSDVESPRDRIGTEVALIEEQEREKKIPGRNVVTLPPFYPDATL